MTPLSFFYTDKQSKIGELIVDAILQESHDWSAKVTEHPVENGETLSDHVQVLPLVLKIEGIISNTPISFLGVPIFTSSNRVEEAYTKLEQIFSKRQPIDIATSLNMDNP